MWGMRRHRRVQYAFSSNHSQNLAQMLKYCDLLIWRIYIYIFFLCNSQQQFFFFLIYRNRIHNYQAIRTVQRLRKYNLQACCVDVVPSHRQRGKTFIGSRRGRRPADKSRVRMLCQGAAWAGKWHLHPHTRSKVQKQQQSYDSEGEVDLCALLVSSIN